jgi:two-component system LytT family response regulator
VIKIRTLIVDDETLARRNLSSLLDLEPDFEIAGECADGRSAIDAITSLRPDLVFLDVQMPGMSGFEVLETLGDEPVPALIFVTAFEQFAVRAFEARALDYLLKPFRRERFHASLGRVRRGLLTRSASPPERSLTAPDRMLVKSGDHLVFVPFAELDFVRAADNYVRLHMAGKTCDVRETITAMEARLPREHFVRIHRSYIVNIAAMLQIYPAGGGEYMVALRGGRHLPVGPRYPSLIRNALHSAGLPRFGGMSAI